MTQTDGQLIPHSIVVAMPISDRTPTHRFFGDGLGLALLGEPSDDGLPEPLQYVVRDDLHLMLIPTTGFSWGLADRPVAAAGHIEAQFTIVVDRTMKFTTSPESWSRQGVQCSSHQQRTRVVTLTCCPTQTVTSGPSSLDHGGKFTPKAKNASIICR